MKYLWLALAAFTFTVLALCGCARFTSVQIQTKADGTRIESKQVISTFWDGQSSVAKMRASTTEKTQGLTVGGYDTEVSSSNIVTLSESIARGAAEGAAKALKGGL